MRQASDGVPATIRRGLVAASGLLVLSFGTTTAIALDYPGSILATPNLVGYWRFESDTGANSSVNGYTGTYLGNAAIGTATSGPVFAGVSGNSALVLDGNGDGVTTSLAGQDQFPTAGTIVAWVYLNQQPSTDVDHNVFQIAARASNGDDFDFQINPDDHLYLFSDSGGSASSPAALPLHRWVMVAGSFDTVAATRKVYIDGRVVGSSTPGLHTPNSATFTIGYSAVWANRWLDGAIDEVAIFDRALSDSEIADLQVAAADLIFRSYFTY